MKLELQYECLYLCVSIHFRDNHSFTHYLTKLKINFNPDETLNPLDLKKAHYFYQSSNLYIASKHGSSDIISLTSIHLYPLVNMASLTFISY